MVYQAYHVVDPHVGLLVGGFNQPLWKMMEFLNGQDDIPYVMESHKIPWFQTTNQFTSKWPKSLFATEWTGRASRWHRDRMMQRSMKLTPSKTSLASKAAGSSMTCWLLPVWCVMKFVDVGCLTFHVDPLSSHLFNKAWNILNSWFGCM